MPLTVGAKALGTSEGDWSACDRLRATAPWSLDAVGEDIVVVAPHPDDESLGVGGILSMLARRGARVTVLAVTDGEASHPRSSTTSRRSLVARRALERERALTALGLYPRIARLGLPDGRVAASHGVASAMVPLLAAASVCFSPFRRDGHPDHDAAGDAATWACRELGIPVVEYPIWAWHWARPSSDDLPWSRARRVDLDAPAREAKARAINAYASQIAPLSAAPGDEAILPPSVLARFHRPFEIVFA